MISRTMIPITVLNLASVIPIWSTSGRSRR